jgi:hypothetical protein
MELRDTALHIWDHDRNRIAIQDLGVCSNRHTMRVACRTLQSLALPHFPGRWILMTVLFGTMLVRGQEALRTAIQADRSYEARQAPVVWPEDQLRAGPVRFDVGAVISAEWNDNVNIAEINRQQDYILRPQVNVRALWPITDRTRLSLGAGIGYTIYLEGNRDDRLLLSPDSELAFDMAIRDVQITIYNRVDYSDDLVSEGGVSDARNYARISNTAGVRATWSLHDWRLQAGYSHFNFWSLTDAFQELDRSSEQVFARVAYALAAATQVGIEASGSITDYREPVRSDFHSLSVGPFVEWSVMEDLRVRLRGGYVRYEFEDRPTGPSLGTLDSHYAGLTLEHRLTPFLSHRLGVSRDVQVGINSDYVERFRTDYSIRWALFDPASVSAGVFYEHSSEPHQRNDERYDQVGFSTGFRYQLISRLSTSVSYRFTWRDSNLAGRDYRQNSVAWSLAYRL